MSIDELTADALQLDAVSRANLAKALISSLDDLSEEEPERLWVDEVTRRREALESGAGKTSPLDEVFARLYSGRE
jgi:putative addiction module component (TIGR02574 family)